MRKYVVFFAVIVGLLFTASANAQSPQGCAWSGIINLPYGSQMQGIYSDNCVWSSGSGHELADWAVGYWQNGNYTIPGCYHMQLLDNGYPMVNGPQSCNPRSPFSLYAGWLYHPYWGRYCSRVWEYEPYGSTARWKQAVPEACASINGYQ